MKTVVALYENLDTARDVVEDLVEAGFSRDRISLIANDASGEYGRYFNSATETVDEDVSGSEGAGFGAVVGGLIGLGAMLIPGIGPVIAAGPLVAGLTGAAVGAAAGAATGGIVASLVNMGVSEDEAGYYAEGVRRGGVLVSVQIDDTWESSVVDIMSRHRPVDIRRSAEEWRRSGWTGFDAARTDYDTYTAGSRTAAGTRAMNEGGQSSAARSQVLEKDARPNDVEFANKGTQTGYRAFESYDTDWRAHYDTAFAARGYDYSYYVPGYHYGYMLATDPRYNQYRTWADVESYARRDWEARGQGAWEDFKDAIQHAWNRIRSAVS